MVKYSVVRDEFGIKEGGLYCFMPFERIDKHKKAMMKIGMATNIAQRIESHMTDFPLGVYPVAFLEKPPVPRKGWGKIKKGENIKKKFYLKIEKFILDYVAENGGKRLHTTTRVRNPDEEGKGQTEWFYCDQETIHNAFDVAQQEYGGKMELYHLEKRDSNDKITFSVNNTARENEVKAKKKNSYTAEIVYFV